MTVDLVIRGGTVVDGTGGEPHRSDVAIDGDRIVAIGRVADRGVTEIDADGHVVTPGFIDGHTHMDAQLFWDPLGTSSCWHGVTTVVMGNCGFTLAPGSPAQRELVVGNLERAEDISGAAIAQAIDWSWTSFAEYLDVVDGLPKGINYAANLGHSALRTWAMGERAYTDRANDAEMLQMEREVAAAMAAGAIGFTTSRTHMHLTTSGQPVASRLAGWDEVSRLVGAMASAGGGIFQLAPETGGGRDERDDFRRRLGALAAATGATCTFGVGANAGGEETLAYIEESATYGATMFGQTNSRGQSVLLSFRTHLPFDHLDGWRQLRQLPVDAMRATLDDPVSRAALVAAADRGPYGPAVGADPRAPDYARIMVMTDPVGPHESVADRATRLQLHPVEAMIQLALDTAFEQLFVQPITEFDPSAAVRAMRHPRTVMTFSDAGAHVSQISDCSIQTHLLAHWVRAEQAFTLAEAVRMLTLEPALAWGLHGRGLLAEGMIADLNVFDSSTVSPMLPTVVNDVPGGGMRFEQRATGFLATIVAGAALFRDGSHTGALPGRLLRRGLSTGGR